jgi:hypothetical protein
VVGPVRIVVCVALKVGTRLSQILMLSASRAGLRLAYLTEWNVNADLEGGTLV